MEHSQDSMVKEIETFIKSKPVAVYMKGSPEFPMCGFSARTIEALTEAGVKRDQIASFNVLENRPLFEVLKRVSNWPTSPQVYVKGKLIGGCDIVCEMLESGELKELIKEI
jgi:monothiol glutaredoxin